VNGSFALPQGPGFGISLDDAKIAEREVLKERAAARGRPRCFRAMSATRGEPRLGACHVNSVNAT
jgi:hypothetical protein